MRNEQLKYILDKINLRDCREVIRNYIYYIRMPVKQRCYRGDGSYRFTTTTNEFLIIAENGEKQGIILRCDDVDLHWYILRPWRKQHVLSNALRTGIIRDVWPENTSITCCCSYDENYDEKRSLTLHLANIAGLRFEES